MAGYANAKSTLGSGSSNKGTLYDRPSLWDGRGGQGGYGPDLSRIPNSQRGIPGGIAGSYGIDYPRIPKGNRSYNQPSHASSLGHAKGLGLGTKMFNAGTVIGGATGATVGAGALTSAISTGAGMLGISGAGGVMAGAGALSFAFPMVAGMALGAVALGGVGVAAPVVGKGLWAAGKVAGPVVGKGLWAVTKGVGKGTLATAKGMGKLTSKIFHALSNNAREQNEMSADNSKTKSRALSEKEQKNLQREKDFANILGSIKQITAPKKRMEALSKAYDLKIPRGKAMQALNRAYSEHLIMGANGKVDEEALKKQISEFAKEKGIGKSGGQGMKAELSRTINDYKDRFLIDTKNNLVNHNLFKQPNKSKTVKGDEKNKTVGMSEKEQKGEKNTPKQEIKPPTDKQNALFSKLSSKATPDNKVVAEWERLSQGGELDRQTAYSLISELKNGGGEPNQPNLAEEQKKAVQAKQPEPQRTNVKEGEQEKAPPVPEKSKEEEKESSKEVNKGKGDQDATKEEEHELGNEGRGR
ncbi:MAG: hypothetical protein IBX45_12450 [Campylobacterales bacterium]|nr:hypothetical protein [Campylobacterales bacterium]